MKKAFVLILTIFYLAGATGAPVNIHYCMGEYAGWDIGHAEDTQCGSCGMDKDQDSDHKCCTDEHKLIKVNDVHKSANAFVHLLIASPGEPLAYMHHIPACITSIAEAYPLINAPPTGGSQPLYLTFRSIRI